MTDLATATILAALILGASIVSVEFAVAPSDAADRPTPSELLSRLERGEMTVREVLNELKPSAEREPS